MGACGIGTRNQTGGMGRIRREVCVRAGVLCVSSQATRLLGVASRGQCSRWPCSAGWAKAAGFQIGTSFADRVEFRGLRVSWTLGEERWGIKKKLGPRCSAECQPLAVASKRQQLAREPEIDIGAWVCRKSEQAVSTGCEHAHSARPA